MDRNQWNRNALESRIDQWREQRAQKMAARLQLNSTKPRTISSNVLGYTNYRQPITLQPGFRQQQEGPRFNHADQRWNPNGNYGGYREHHSLHNQYHGDYRNHGDQRNHVDHRNHGDPRNRVDHRNHGYGHGSYQHHGQKKGGHFSSHKSLYNDKKSNKPSKRFSSSCSSINDNALEVGNQNAVCHPSESGTLAENNSNVNAEVVTSSSVTTNDHETIQQLIEPQMIQIDEENLSEDKVELLSEPGETSPENPTIVYDCTDVIHSEVVTSIEEIPTVEQMASPEINIAVPEETLDLELSLSYKPELENDNKDGAVDPLELNVKVTENSESNKDNNIEAIEQVASPKISDETLDVNLNLSYEPKSENVDTDGAVDPLALNVNVIEDSELNKQNSNEAIEQVASPKISDETLDVELNLSYEPKSENVDTDGAVDPLALNVKVTEDSELNKQNNSEAIEKTASPEINIVVTDETSDSEFNLSYKPESGNVETDGAVDPLALNVKVAEDSELNQQINNEGIEGNYSGTSNNKNAAIFPVALLVPGDSDTEASIIRFDDISSESDEDLSKEMDLVENKFSNISIANNDDMISDKECFTPMKRERRQALLDATNILPSSTIKYAVREVRTNDESEIIVTPVRRSARLSTLTPVSTQKSRCVQKLDELSPEVIQKMKFVENPAIDSVPEC